MTPRRLAGTGAAVALGMLLACGLTSCSLPWKTASPWSKGTPQPAQPTTQSQTLTEPPIATPSPTSLSIPESRASDVIRLIYAQGDTAQSLPVALPDSSGYAISVGCLAETPDAELTYTLAASEEPYSIIQSGTLSCDGTTQRNETSTPANEDTVRLWLSGDLDVIDSAFAILTLL